MTDPVFDRLVTEIAAVEQSLDTERIRAIVVSNFQQIPIARRTLDLLVTSPALLTSMDPQMPPAAARLLLRLKQAGAVTVQPPGCALCGKQRALRRPLPEGRICDPCSRRGAKIVDRCARCHEERALQQGPATEAYCKRCWTDMRDEAQARIVDAVRRQRRVSAKVIGEALENMPPARDRRVRLMLELETSGSRWFTDPATGSTLFGTFYDQLRHSGAQLPERRCAGCGTTRTLTERLGGKLSCRRCYRRTHRSPCNGCGDMTHIERVLSDGQRLCQRCTNKLPDENADCITCGNHRLIAFRGPKGPLCSTCRAASKKDTCTSCGTAAPCSFQGTEQAICKSCSDAASVDTCILCGNTRRCRWAGTDRAICEQCSNPRTPCVICRQTRLHHRRVADGSGYLCWACTPQIIEACTSCGDDRIVNGRIDGNPFCPLCYPKQPESFRPCAGCGTVTRLIARHCPRCRADQMIRQMVPDDLATYDPRIATLRERWFCGAPSKVIYAFELGTGACTMITRLLAEPELRTHEFLDSAGSESQTRSVRSVLVEHGLLPPRDELLARFEAWLSETLSTIPDQSERRHVTQYARWRHLRLLRKNTTPLRAGQLSWRRIEITNIIELLAWTRDHGGSMATLSQTELDVWLAHGARPHLHHFVQWTSDRRLTVKLVAPVPNSFSLCPSSISDDERWRLLADVTTDTGLDARTKFAAGLMLMFGIRAATIVQLREQDITITDETVIVRLGTAPLILPAELAPSAKETFRHRTAPRLFVESVEQEWLFPGARAGHHMAPGSLNGRLRSLGIPPRLARASALIALGQELPPVVLSRLTGLEIGSAIAWSNAIAANDSVYGAAVIERVGVDLSPVVS